HRDDQRTQGAVRDAGRLPDQARPRPRLLRGGGRRLRRTAAAGRVPAGRRTARRPQCQGPEPLPSGGGSGPRASSRPAREPGGPAGDQGGQGGGGAPESRAEGPPPGGGTRRTGAASRDAGAGDPAAPSYPVLVAAAAGRAGAQGAAAPVTSHASPRSRSTSVTMRATMNAPNAHHSAPSPAVVSHTSPASGR